MRTQRIALVLLIAAIAAGASACTGRTIWLEWNPNPIVMKPDQEKIEGRLTIKVQGFLSSFHIDTIFVEAFDEDGEAARELASIPVNRPIPFFVPSFTLTETVTLDVGYDAVKESRLGKIQIVVTGDQQAVAEVEIKLEEE